MAGFREFSAGEPLTASNVDGFLMKQSVMKFADAAARDIALGTAVAGGNAIREGMVSYLDAEKEVQYFDGTAWDAISQTIPGIGSNVVQTVKTDVFTSTSTSFTAVDGLTATITPSSESSKVLVIGTIQGASLESSGSSRNFGRLVRGSTAIGIGDAEGSRTQATVNISTRDAGAFNVMSATAVLLDSPSSTTATTYGWQVVTPAGITLYVNRAQDDNNDNQRARLISTITLIEVAE